MLERHPPHVRRKIALLVTAGIAVVLIVVLVWDATKPKDTTVDAASKLRSLFKSMVERTDRLQEENRL